MEPQLPSSKGEIEPAVERSPGHSEASSPRKATRGRGGGCLNADETRSPETNGARVPGSGRVLRDRSTRNLPAWRQNDLEEDRAEGTRDAAANRRRKAMCPRRRRSAAAAADLEQTDECEESKDGVVSRASRGRRMRSCRGPPRTVFKVEPETDSDYEGDKSMENTETSVEKKEDESIDDDDLVEEDEPSYVDDPKDRNYYPHSRISEEEAISSEEDVPFNDDMNDQSYDPKDLPKQRRKPITRHERKDKTVMIETEEDEHDTEIKTEGGESADERTGVELAGEVAELPRKRGRRRKDDKTPRLPKRRKKPPVQYVRCEMEGCGTVLAHPRYLQHHIKYQHMMKKKYVCPHPSCGRLFRLQKQLLRHAKHHTDQRDYICEFCARAFKSSHNLAVHRMIHTGEKPLQCEICGFTCRQKASLNWHMKKHDADATYQFSCSICGKKFEKKDSVVAHKAKSHPEVLIAEALAANAGSLITTPVGVSTMLESSTGSAQTDSEAQGSNAPAGQVGPMMMVDTDNALHTMQVPVTLALTSTEDENSATSQHSSSQALQMPLQFVTAPVSQHQHQIQQLQPATTITQQAALVQHLPAQSFNPQPQIVHMTFRALPQQQMPLLSVAQQLPLQTTQALTRPSNNPPLNTSHHSQTLSNTSSDCRSSLGFAPNHPSASPRSSTGPSETRQIIWVGDGVSSNGNGAEAWEARGDGEEHNMVDGPDGQIQRVLI